MGKDQDKHQDPDKDKDKGRGRGGCSLHRVRGLNRNRDSQEVVDKAFRATHSSRAQDTSPSMVGCLRRLCLLTSNINTINIRTSTSMNCNTHIRRRRCLIRIILIRTSILSIVSMGNMDISSMDTSNNPPTSARSRSRSCRLLLRLTPR